uniref:malate:quinone oxidoreductase n=1 Tax=Paenibacillus xylanexedens TaxID=528191 RepID=UPI0016435A07
SLLFPPFPPFSPNFLNTPSNPHLITSLNTHNLLTILPPPLKQISLTNYLIQHLILSNDQPIHQLPHFLPPPKTHHY